ncbi:hypothetical protein F5Y18DRAFT_115596 [Xylariaceae sp. FL1019]|nr:hypothetical protein F5Y18DRAFT_115596 [Xylariaceae sp. FL1019]
MGGQFSQIDTERCQHYAAFASHLDRIHFDALYWTFFFLVIGSLFVASWIFQWTMRYRDHPAYTQERFRRKLTISLILTLGIFAITAVLLVIEVYALLALQFCSGEDLMSLYWATWTMLQLGSEIAILGVSLALWHHLWDFEHPLWALALGTPVLVVAGFGHVLALVARRFYKKAKTNMSSKGNNSVNSSDEEAEEGQSEKERRRGDSVAKESFLENGQTYFFTLDTGADKRVQQWPAFVGLADGKAVVRLTAIPDSSVSLPVEARAHR